MLNIHYDVFAKEDDSMKLEISSLAQKNLTNNIRRGYRYNYYCNKKDHETLQKMFEHRLIYQDPEADLRESSHPILAILNEFSNFDANNQINRLREKGLTVMTIGDSVLPKLKPVHNCLLLSSARDTYRVGSSSAEHTSYHNYANGRRNFTPHCVNGAQNCYFKANVCFCIHSTYDISFSNIAKIFDNHNLDRMVVYMYIPLALYDKQYNDHELNGFKCTFNKYDSNRVYFSMSDFSTPYCHDYRIWRDWAIISKIRTKHFDINIEHVRNYGPLHIINLVRCRKSLPIPTKLVLDWADQEPNIDIDIMPIYVPISKYLGNLYRVPNILHACRNGFRYDQDETPHYFAPAGFVENVLNYAARVKDESYKFSEVAAAASGYKTQIIIGNQVYREKWDVQQNHYDHIVISLFIIGALKRSIRTRTISSCFKELKDLDSMGWFGEKWKSFSRWFGKMTNIELGYDENAMGKLLNEWNVIRCDDLIFNECYEVEDNFPPVLVPPINITIPPVNPFTGKPTFPSAPPLKPVTPTPPPTGPALSPPVIPTGPFIGPLPRPILFKPPPITPIAPPIIARPRSKSADLNSILSIWGVPKGGKFNKPISPQPLPIVSNPPDGSTLNVAPSTSSNTNNLVGASTSANVEQTIVPTPSTTPPMSNNTSSPVEKSTLVNVAQPTLNIVNNKSSMNINADPEDIIEVISEDADQGFYTKHFIERNNKGNIKFKSDSQLVETKPGTLTGDLLSKDMTPQQILNRIKTVPTVITYMSGDLFKAPADNSLAHCVAEDFHMGAGIAVEFRRRYGQVDTLLKSNTRTGGCTSLKDHTSPSTNRHIIYLVTKIRSNGRPTYDTLAASLFSMVALCVTNKITKVAIPKLGCGLDGLDWARVSSMIDKTFSSTGISIFVYDGKNNSDTNKLKDGANKSDDQGRTGVNKSDSKLSDGAQKKSSKPASNPFNETTSVKSTKTHSTTTMEKIIEEPIINETVPIQVQTAVAPVNNLIKPTTTPEQIVKDPATQKQVDPPQIDNNLNLVKTKQNKKTGFVWGIDGVESYSDVVGENLPRAFIAGHCAIKAVWECFSRDERPSPKKLLKISFDLLMMSDLAEPGEVLDYIIRGQWDSDCSAVIIGLLAKHYKFNIDIKEGDNVVKHRYGKNDETPHRIDFAGSHYTNMNSSRGGAIAKFNTIVDKFATVFKDGSKVIELSAAPGYLINKLFQWTDNNNVFPTYYAGVFKGVCAADFTQRRSGIQIEYFDGGFSNLFKNIKFDVIINDAGRDINTEALTSDGIRFVQNRLVDGGSVMLKTFGDPHDIYELATHFKEYEFINGVQTERYFIGHGYKIDKDSNRTSEPIRPFTEVYDAHHIALTHHVITADKTSVSNFNRTHFAPPFTKYHQNLRKFKNTIEVRCYTGYASSSKTTNLIEMFPKAVFVAPTKELSRSHQNKGVKSFTQHSIFGAGDIKDEIIIDELSQFCVEFVIILQNRFPSAKIILCGDVHQTEFANYKNSIKFTSFTSMGIKNNIIDVYKIPQDIATALNKKFSWNIRSHSEVNKSVYKLSGVSLDKIVKDNSDLKVICYNSATAKSLIEKGINASTITTYTGSRTSNVVLFIDAAAIESNYINKDSVTYTALTRATHRLFLYGETESLTKYYNFDATLIGTYSDFNKIYYHDETYVNADVSLPLTQHVQVQKDDSVTTLIAENILDGLVKPANPVYKDASTITNCTIPEVESGTLITNETLISNIPKEEHVFNVSKTICNVINQRSDQSVQTIKTLVKRYSKKYQSHDKRESRFAYTQLLNGLCKALYGSPHHHKQLQRDLKIDEKELLKYAFDYIESLSDKLGEAYITTDDLLKIFDMDKDGQLKFFNKRQSKWKPEDGFDRTDKVGQGVAAFQKKVNIIFSAYARALLDKVRSILKRNNRKILLATHNSEAGINDEFIQLMANTSDTLYTCNDFREWDASFREPFSRLTSTLLGFMGADNILIKWFAENRKHWSMIYQNIFGDTKLYGNEKQFSGNPFTICENTIGNMALCFAIFDYKNFQFGLFKGDDSAVACSKCTFTPEAAKILNYTGHGLKLHNSPIGEFAGWFLTNDGIFPDVVRYASKFLSKNYRDRDHYEEALMSLQERCSSVKNATQLEHGCYVTALYYSEVTGNHVTKDEVGLLFHFLQNSREIKFEDLHEVVKYMTIVESTELVY